MNQTINNKITALTNLIAEIRDKDDETDCLIVELDYLINHLQQYKKTCEECAGCEDKKHDKEFPDHGRCDNCHCCIGCGCCDCDDDWMCGLCGEEWSQEEEFCPDCSEYGQEYK